MRHCVLCHAVVGSVPYATVRHKRIIKPLLTENHSPIPFIYPVRYCLVFFWFHLFTFSEIHFPFISVAGVISCTISFRTESMLRMRCLRKVLNQLLHVSWQEKTQRRIPSKRSEMKVVDDANLYINVWCIGKHRALRRKGMCNFKLYLQIGKCLSQFKALNINVETTIYIFHESYFVGNDNILRLILFPGNRWDHFQQGFPNHKYQHTDGATVNKWMPK